MLVLSRHVYESIMIGDDIVITVLSIRGDKVRIGIDAPAYVRVDREEVREAIRREDRRMPGPPDGDGRASHPPDGAHAATDDGGEDRP